MPRNWGENWENWESIAKLNQQQQHNKKISRSKKDEAKKHSNNSKPIKRAKNCIFGALNWPEWMYVLCFLFATESNYSIPNRIAHIAMCVHTP